MVQYPAGYIPDVRSSFPQVFILHRSQRVRIFFCHLMERIVDVHIFGFDEAFHLPDQCGIFQDQ